MQEVQRPRRIVFLPKRLADHVALIDASVCSSAAASESDYWGLTDRIDALPGISPRHTLLANDTLTTDHFIDPAYILGRSCSRPKLLCHMDCDGILLPEMSMPDREEVLRKGWASCASDAVSLFPPRDSIEMEIAWRIILLAYHYLTSMPDGSPTREKTTPVWPVCSSTAKYWV